MAKKFSNSDLFEQNLFDEPIQKAEQFLVLIRDIEKSSAKAIKEQAKVLKDFSKISGLDELRKIKEAIDKINQSTDQMLKLKREERQLEDKLNSAKTEQAKQNEKLKQSINEQNKATREQIKNEKALIDIQNKEIKTIQQLQEKNNALIRTRKNLDLTTKEGVKDYQRLTNEIRRNNTELKKHDAAVGSYTRNVGNYGSAIKGFGTQLLGVLGAGSFLMVAQNAVAINAQFGQSMADLKVITGATDEQMKFFEKTALEQTKTMDGSTASATQYAEALKLIASAKPELLQNSEALKEVTDQALILSDASGLELPDAATRLTDAMNQFGAGADQASKFVNVLAGSAKFGSAEIPQVTEALLEFGPVAKSYNVSISESAAAIEGLAEKGIKGSEAGTKLRNVLLALGAAKGLPKEAQESFERAGIDVNILSDNSLSLNQRLTELSKAQNDEVAMLKIFGKENISAAKSVLSQKDRILELTNNIDGYTNAGEDAANRTGTLSAEMQKLSNAWQTAMIEFGRGGGELAKTVKFIRQNLDTIILVVTKVVKGFLVYKGTILAVNTAMKIGKGATEIYGAAMSLFAKNTDGATKSFKTLDASMKANVIGLVAVAVYELADALGFFTSEAETAQEIFETSTGTFDKIIEGENKIFDSRIDAMKKRHQKALDLANNEEKELIKLNQRGELRKAYQEKLNEISGDLVEITERRKKNIEELRKLDADYRKSNDEDYKYDNIQQQKAVINELNIQDSKISTLKIQRKLYKDAIDDLNHEQLVDEKNNADESVNISKEKNNSQIADAQRRADEIKRIELDLKRYLEDLTAENIDDEKQREIEQERLRFEREKESIKEKYDKIGKLTKEQTEQQDKIEIQLEEQHQDKLRKIRQKYDDIDLQKKMDDIEFEFTLLEDSATRKIKDEDDLQKALEQLAIDKLKREIKLLEDSAADKKIIADKQLELDKLLRDQQNKTLDDAKKKQDALAKAIKDGLDATKDALEKQKKQTKDLIDAAQLLADELTKIFIEQSKRREEILDKEIENSKTRQDQLRQIAERGVLEADQSLAAEERKQAELERKKMQEQKKQQRIELANTAFKAYTGHVENRDASPLSSTIRDITALTAFISSLPTFFEGTENTGKGGNLDNKGGFSAILHPNERVMTAEQNKELAGLTNNDVVRIVKESESVKLHSSDAVNNMKMAERFAIDMSWKTNEQIINKVDELIKTVENKPVQFVYVDQISNKLVSEIKKGNNSIKTHYSKPNING
jgi:TP901 family phage tail tape measure protein